MFETEGDVYNGLLHSILYSPGARPTAEKMSDDRDGIELCSYENTGKSHDVEYRHCEKNQDCQRRPSVNYNEKDFK